MHNELGYYCIGCFNHFKKKYYLKKIEGLFLNGDKIAWRCPHCDFTSVNSAFQEHWKEHMKKISSQKENKKEKSSNCRLIENAKHDPTWDESLNAKLCPGECQGCVYNIHNEDKNLEALLSAKHINFTRDPNGDYIISKDSTEKIINLIKKKN